MSHVLRFLQQPIVEAAGWALIHFLWQGAAIACVVVLMQPVLRVGRASGE